MVVALLCMSGAAQAADDEAALRNRFLKGVAETAAEVMPLAHHAKYSIEDEYPIGDRASTVEEFQCSLQGQFAKATGKKQGVEIETDTVKNDKYAFAVTRSPGVERYTLAWLAPSGGATPEEERQIQYTVDSARAVLLGNWHLYGKFVWEWVKTPHSNLKSFREERTDDGSFVRVEFDYLPTGTKGRLTDGFMVLDPSSHWSLREYGITLSNGAKSHSFVHLQSGSDGFPAPHRIITTFSSPGDDSHVAFKRTVTIERLAQDDLDEDEFYLTHYGLPEPNFERGGVWVWLKYLIAGALCLAISFGVRWWRGRAAG